MIVLLSPAKTLDYSQDHQVAFTQPGFLNDSKGLIKTLKQKEPKDIASLMGLSDKLATLNFDRYQSWSGANKPNHNNKPAIYVFQGDVYQGLEAEDFKAKDIKFAQQHLRILSGLYGELRPLDLIEPYRLEMGTRLKTSRGKNLYEFWGNKIVKNIVSELKKNKSDLIINLASQEYFKVVKDLDNKTQVISPVFKDYKNGTYKIISFYAKKARGLMARYIVLNKVTTPKGILNFNLGGYKYSQQESSPDAPVFLRKS